MKTKNEEEVKVLTNLRLESLQDNVNKQIEFFLKDYSPSNLKNLYNDLKEGLKTVKEIRDELIPDLRLEEDVLEDINDYIEETNLKSNVNSISFENFLGKLRNLGIVIETKSQNRKAYILYSLRSIEEIEKWFNFIKTISLKDIAVKEKPIGLYIVVPSKSIKVDDLYVKLKDIDNVYHENNK